MRVVESEDLLFLSCDHTNGHVEIFEQGVEPFNFSGSGSIWVQQRFQISVQFRSRN